MKANELMIGNYVKLKGYDKPIRVLIIDTTETSTNTKYEPIPLTEEWLLEFGFEKQENNWKRLCICNDWTYLYWERLAGVELSVNKHSVMLSHIKYVHQLQNLFFALTNQELTIKESTK